MERTLQYNLRRGTLYLILLEYYYNKIVLKVQVLSLSVFLRIIEYHSNLKLFSNIIFMYLYLINHNYYFTFVQLLYRILWLFYSHFYKNNNQTLTLNK